MARLFVLTGWEWGPNHKKIRQERWSMGPYSMSTILFDMDPRRVQYKTAGVPFCSFTYLAKDSLVVHFLTKPPNSTMKHCTNDTILWCDVVAFVLYVCNTRHSVGPPTVLNIYVIKCEMKSPIRESKVRKEGLVWKEEGLPVTPPDPQYQVIKDLCYHSWIYLRYINLLILY